jgi:anti-sigma regulatory factor (Ser/Thr protein kinase)
MVISAEPKLLHIMREVVRYYARQAGFPESEAYQLTLAVDEAATNVIRHTYKKRPNGRLALEVRNLLDRLEFVLEDTGPKVRSDAIRPRALGDVRPGGLGSFSSRVSRIPRPTTRHSLRAIASGWSNSRQVLPVINSVCHD